MSGETEEVDYQLGAHKLDTSGSIVDDDEVIEFDFESGAVFRRLADDIYESPEAGIREPLTNAITTVRRVFDDVSDGVIKITVQDGEQVMLRLRDNGEGISKGVLNEVLTVIGRSNARDDGELSGQYGMGFLASYKLVGLDGGFLMCTNPRDTDDGPYSGLFKPGTFEPDKGNSLPQLLEEDEYGTAFEYYVRDDISISDIRQWVEKHAQWSPVPIIYQELDEDGSVEYNEDFHASSLDDMYDDSPFLHVENSYYEAATSPQSKNDIILITSPVSMSGTRTLRRKLPWQVDLRLKYENGVVFKGPHEGMVPVREKEYEEMDESRQSNYIPESELESEDMTLPEPTGTRERMRRHRDFLSHVNSQLKEKYLSQVERTLNSFNPDNSSLQDLDDMGRHILLRIFKEFENTEDCTTDEIKSKLSSSYNYDTDDENLLEFIRTMTSKLPVVSKDKGYSKKYPRKAAYELQEDEETVYMCVSQNSWKSEAVEKSELPTHIVKVESAGDYNPFQKHLGWEKLKSIKKSNAPSVLDLEEAEIEDLRGKDSTTADNVQERSVTVHVESGGRSTISREASDLIEHYNGTRRSSRLGDVLVLFPRQGGENISDHYALADNRCCVATCGGKLAKHLTSNSENIVSYDDYSDWVLSADVTTSDGVETVAEFLSYSGDVFIKVLNGGDGEDVIQNTSILHVIADQIGETKPYENPRLGAIESSRWTHVNNLDLEIGDCTVVRTNRRKTSSYSCNMKSMNFVKLFMKGYTPNEIHETEEFTSICDSYDNISKEVLVDCEWLTKLHNKDDSEFSSVNPERETSVTLPKHQTKEGKQTIRQIYEDYDAGEVVVHSLSTEEYDYFTTDSMLENGHQNISGKTIGRNEIPRIPSNAIYVPVLETEYKNIKNHIKDNTVVIGEWNRGKDRVFDISAKYVYATMNLGSESSKDLKKLVGNHGLDIAVNIVDSFSQVADKSVGYTDDKTDVIAEVNSRTN